MKSPLKAKALRNPGESLEQELLALLLDKAIPNYIVAAVFVVMAVTEWLRWLTGAPPQPWLYTIIALVSVAIAVWKIVPSAKKASRLRLGGEGEKAVGQFLERLREDNAQVLHDIPGDNFNLDHVVIHRTGIYVVETKTLSKPERGEAKLVFDGDSIRRNGLEPERNPITQVRAARGWLSDLLKESTGKSLPVRAVVLYPGWFIQPTAEAKASDVWVLNPKAFPSFIAHSATTLSTADVKLSAYHLGRYVRCSNA